MKLQVKKLEAGMWAFASEWLARTLDFDGDATDTDAFDTFAEALDHARAAASNPDWSVPAAVVERVHYCAATRAAAYRIMGEVMAGETTLRAWYDRVHETVACEGDPEALAAGGWIVDRSAE